MSCISAADTPEAPFTPITSLEKPGQAFAPTIFPCASSMRSYQLGRVDEAIRIAERASETVSATYESAAAAALGRALSVSTDNERTMSVLQRAVSTGRDREQRDDATILRSPGISSRRC